MEEFLQKGMYYIMRKCSNAHQALGYDSLWDMKVPQFFWLISQISEEFKPKKEKKIKR